MRNFRLGLKLPALAAVAKLVFRAAALGKQALAAVIALAIILAVYKLVNAIDKNMQEAMYEND